MLPSLSLSSSSSLTSFSLYLLLIKISSISFGKGFLIHHICSRFGPIRDLLYLEVQNLLRNIFSRYLQKTLPSWYAVQISKVKELKYQQLWFNSDICCNFSQTELHIIRRYDKQILPVLLKDHQIYSSHLQVLPTCFGIWNCSGVFWSMLPFVFYKMN